MVAGEELNVVLYVGRKRIAPGSEDSGGVDIATRKAVS